MKGLEVLEVSKSRRELEHLNAQIETEAVSFGLWWGVVFKLKGREQWRTKLRSLGLADPEEISQVSLGKLFFKRLTSLGGASETALQDEPLLED